MAVFALAAAVVMTIFYEGMLLKWFSFVGPLMLALDVFFIAATLCSLVYFRKRKLLLALNLFSLAIIIIALAMELFKWTYPEILMVFWDFYILFFYFTLLVKQTWKHPA
jgi:hypothetical protein